IFRQRESASRGEQPAGHAQFGLSAKRTSQVLGLSSRFRPFAERILACEEKVMSQTQPKGGRGGANEPEQVRKQTWKGQSFNGILRGKIAVVTGAARGIGRSIAVDFAANGADVIGIDICREVSPILEFQPATKEQLDQTGELVKANGRRWLAISADIRNIAELRAAAERTAVALGGIDI